MNQTINNSLNQTIGNIENTGTIGKIFSSSSEWVTNKIIGLMSGIGLEVTQRWAGLLTFFILAGLIYLAMQISKPIIKWTLIIIGAILILGLLVPSW